jgi:hypothetical protein
MRRAKKRRGKKRAAIDTGKELIDFSRQWDFNLVYILTPTTANVIAKASGIGDAAVGALVNSFAVDRVVRLNLSHNNVTVEGCKSIVTLLDAHFNLKELDLSHNNIGDEGALVFGSALAVNHKLKYLNINHNGITAKGWSTFSKVLCNASSINDTFLSNHTLEMLSVLYMDDEADAVLIWLYLNRSFEDKRQVAVAKIAMHHQDFNMQPFFAWGMKVLPLAVKWFERAEFTLSTDWFGRVSPFAVSPDSERMGKQKLDVIYQFIHAMPDIFE